MSDAFAAAKRVRSPFQSMGSSISGGPPTSASMTASDNSNGWHTSGPTSSSSATSFSGPSGFSNTYTGSSGAFFAQGPIDGGNAANSNAFSSSSSSMYGSSQDLRQLGSSSSSIPPSSSFGAAGSAIANDLMGNVASSNPLAAMALQSGEQMVKSGLAAYLPGVSALWESTRFYFHVTNDYVLKKIRRLLFPFAFRGRDQWIRKESNRMGGGGDASPAYQTPDQDDNAPDLYIPLMAFITYVLAVGLIKGLDGKFHPEVIPQVMSVAGTALLLEVALMSGSLYLLSVKSINYFDLIAYSGYKYISLVVNLVVGLCFGPYGYYSSLGYSSICMFYFMMNTLWFQLRPDLRGRDAATGNLGGGGGDTLKAQRTYFAIGASLCQMALLWWMGVSASAFSSAVTSAVVGAGVGVGGGATLPSTSSSIPAAALT